MYDIELKMPKTESDGDNGINDGNIETYKNKPMMSLTKEELQNSSDGALVNSNGEKEQVIVEFHDFLIETKDIPDVLRLSEVYKEEWEYWNEVLLNDKKAIGFLNKARNLLKKDKIRCLRISDFNTTGLTGVTRTSSPWRNLVKNRGVSDKPSYATGSFGIGKDAAFACSELRTVFYNTINTDLQDNCAFQGVLKLPSYKKNGDNYVGDGFFSKKSEDKTTNPLMQSISLDPTYTRNSTGMDKYIIGFPEDLSDEELKSQLIASSINNFLYAFWADKLVVKYDDIIVDHDHLDEIFEKYDSEIEKLTKEYYETLKNPDEMSSVSILEENDVQIYVKLMQNAGRRAAITRQSGMKVFDKARIHSRIEFSAVVVLAGDKVNGFFKKLENPEHTGWSLDRADVKSEVSARQKAIFDRIKEMITELHQADYDTSIDADGVSEYLPLTYITGRKKKVEGLSNEVEKKEKAKRKKKKIKPQVVEQDEIHYEEDEQGNIIESSIEIVPPKSNGHNGGGGTHTGDGTDKIGGGDKEKQFNESETGDFISKKIIPSSNFKFMLLNDNDNYKLKVVNDTEIKKGFAEILISGETSADVIPLKFAKVDGNNAVIKNNKILFDGLAAKSKHDIEFGFIRPGDWAIEVKIHEN